MKGPGKYFRKGMTIIELFEMFPDEESAVSWFEELRWPGGQRECPHCASKDTKETKSRRPQPYQCNQCRKYFSVRIGSLLQSSRIPLRKWAIAIHFYATNLKGVSSMKLHRDLGITQKSAWYMLHRIRAAFSDGKQLFEGVVEVDENFMGGLESGKHESKKQKSGRGGVGKAIVVGMKERSSRKVKAKVIKDTKRSTLHRFIEEYASRGSIVCTDDFTSYRNMSKHGHLFVKHSAGEYVDEMARVNGIESFWSMLKRGHKGVYHKMSKKHLHLYVSEFKGRYNIRELDTIGQMEVIALMTMGKRLSYEDLVSKTDDRPF